MAGDYITVPVVLRGPLVGDIMRTEPPPPGARSLAIPDGNGGFIDVGLADLEDLLGGSQQPAPTYTAGPGITISPANEISAVASAPVVALVGGVETAYPTLAAAIADSPDVIHLHAEAEVSTVTSNRFTGLLFCHGHAITIVNGGQLKLGRFTIVYNGSIDATGNGNILVVGAGNPGTSNAVPPASECLQQVDTIITAPLNFDPIGAGAYQGLALRGNSLATNVASGGGPIYLFDLAEVSFPLPASFTVYNKRPGVTVGIGSVLQFDKDYEYPAIASGTFTVDTAGTQVGVTVRVRLEATASAPTLPAGFTRYGGAHSTSKANLYSFCVAADGTIDYYITQPA